jgi:hypothetical protein
MAKSSVQIVEIPAIKTKRMDVAIKGISPLICHRFSEKAKKQMLEKQQKKASAGKEKRDPWMEFCQSLYWLTDMPETPTAEDVEKATFGFPAVGLKAAAVRAATDVGLNMTDTRRMFHVLGEYVTINGTPRMREDTVTIGRGSTDLRYRGEFPEWSCTFEVQYNSGVAAEEQIFNLFNTAGFGVGIGDWRPQKNGSFGRFELV